MASTTAITYVDGELIGDPLDIKMFEATEWTLKEPTATDHNMALQFLYPPKFINPDDVKLTRDSIN